MSRKAVVRSLDEFRQRYFPSAAERHLETPDPRQLGEHLAKQSLQHFVERAKSDGGSRHRRDRAPQ